MADAKGFLTSTDREFLRGEKEYDSKQSRYDRRQAIRERTRAAFADFALLEETLDESERNKIFDPPHDEVPDLHRSMIDTITFLYHALEGDVGSNAAQYRSFHYPFKPLLEAGVELGELARRPHTDGRPQTGIPDVDFDVDYYEPMETDHAHVVEDLAKNFGRGLSEEELRTTILHAARETVTEDGSVVTDDAFEQYSGFRGLAKLVEEKRQELRDENGER